MAAVAVVAVFGINGGRVKKDGKASVVRGATCEWMAGDGDGNGEEAEEEEGEVEVGEEVSDEQSVPSSKHSTSVPKVSW